MKRFLSDRTALISLLGLCLVLKVIVLARDPILARDGIHYIQFAYDLCAGADEQLFQSSFAPLSPNRFVWTNVFEKHPYHPGYPFVVAGCAKVYQWFRPGDLSPTEWQWCAHVAASIAGLMLVLPLYALARCVLPTHTAWLGTALFLILPAPVQITTDALAESWLLLFLLISLWCLVRAVRDPRPRWFALAGALAGCGYLVRPEAVVIPAAALLTLVTFRWWNGHVMPWRPALRGGVLLVAGFLYVAAPYMLLIGKFSARPSANQVVELATDVLRSGASPDSSACFAERRQDGVNGRHIDRVRMSDAVTLVGSALGKAGHYFLWPLAAAGAVLLWRTRRGDPALGLFTCTVVTYLAMLLRLAYSAGYTSERHTLLIVSLASLFAARALVHFSCWIRERYQGGWLAPWAFGLVLVGLSLSKALQPLHAGQAGHRQAGLWLAKHSNGLTTVHDPYLWATFYSGKLTTSSLPIPLQWGGRDLSPEEVSSRLADPIRFHPIPRERIWAVVDPRDADLNRNQVWQQAGVLAVGSVTVWAWPSVEAPKLLIREAPETSSPAALK